MHYVKRNRLEAFAEHMCTDNCSFCRAKRGNLEIDPVIDIYIRHAMIVTVTISISLLGNIIF